LGAVSIGHIGKMDTVPEAAARPGRLLQVIDQVAERFLGARNSFSTSVSALLEQTLPRSSIRSLVAVT
jgi:hypothetical protein